VPGTPRFGAGTLSVAVGFRDRVVASVGDQDTVTRLALTGH
jgi:hypothetical protein